MSLNNGYNPASYHGQINGSFQHVNGGVPVDGSAAADRIFLDVTEEHAKILKALDELRRLKIDQGRNGQSLPQIIVCGAQSSGKSSVLEAIIGIPFQTDSKACTRYKTRVRLNRKPGEKEKVTLTIIPDSSRPGKEAKDLMNSFDKSIDRVDWRNAMSGLMEEANAKIFCGSKRDKLWTNDTLQITISGPEEQDLELLDLPGLIVYDPQAAGNIEMVEEMVRNEMKKTNSIVLLVAVATGDVEGHKILQMCKNEKIPFQRTLGVLTMPDEAGSRADDYVKIVQGQDEQFKVVSPMAWHVVRNRNEEERNSSSDDRDRKEARFFENEAPWNQLNSNDRGIVTLRKRLAAMLFNVAKEVLPRLFKTLSMKEKTLQAQMANLGGDLNEKELKRAFKFSTERLKHRASLHRRALYESDLVDYDGPHAVHLRARVQEQNVIFRERLLRYGMTWDLDTRVSAIDPYEDVASTRRLDTALGKRQVEVKEKDQAVQYFADLLNSMPKKGLRGSDTDSVVNKEFWRLTRKWKRIAEEHIESVFECLERYFEVITPLAFAKTVTVISPKDAEGFGNYEVVAKRFNRRYVAPAIEDRKAKALRELQKLEEDRLDIPDNLDREFQRKLKEHHERERAKAFMMVQNNQDLDEQSELEPADIAKSQNLDSKDDYAAESAHDLLARLWAHYEIASRQFVANVLTQIVERHLMRRVEDIVNDELEVEEIRELVKSNEDVEAQKMEIREKLETITQSLAVLEPFDY